MANTVLAKMAVQIAANTADFNRKLSETNNKLSGFQNGLTKIAGFAAAAFSTQQLAQFAFEVSKLAGEFSAVEAAFAKLPDSEDLMVRLKSATAETVSELALMKRTVQAANFGISLEALPRLLEFAAVRAQQTGQSVDYLVDSIVTGIGRKSPLILDNLGISAVALKEELNGVSVAAADVGQVAEAVGRIASRELANMGSLANNTATDIDRLSAAWENLKVSIGNAANETGLFSRLLELSAKFFNDISGRNEGLNALLNVLNKAQAEGGKLNLTFNQNVETLRRLKEEGNQLTITFKDLVDLTSRFGDPQIYRVVLTQLQDIVKVLDAPTGGADGPSVFNPLTFEELAKSLAKSSEQVETINTLTERLNELTARRNDLTADQVSIVNVEIKAIKEKIKYLDELGTVQQQLINLSRAGRDTRDPITGVTSTGSNGLFNVQLPDFKEIVKPIREEFIPAAQEVINISGLVSGGIIEIADAFGQAASGSINFGDAILRSLGSFSQQFGALLIANGLATIAFKKFSGPGMIAAGAALVAIGGAIKGVIANRPNLSGSGTSGGFSSTRTIPSSNFAVAQNGVSLNLAPTTVIRGQDLFVIWKNYNENNRATRSSN